MFAYVSIRAAHWHTTNAGAAAKLSANDTAAVALNTACQTKQGVTNNTENVKYLFNGFYF